jgi:dihydrofolate reductase
MVKYTWVLAVSTNGVIGKSGKLPWRLADDLKLFREATLGHMVLMGRKTFEDVGKPLPNRTNLILSRDESRSFPDGCHVFSSLEDAVEFVDRKKGDREELMVIGGEALFEATRYRVTKVYLTRVLADVDGDTFFRNDFSSEEGWRQVGKTVRFEAGQRNQHAFERVIYERADRFPDQISQ